MRAWRLARRRHAALDGTGARLYGGRWNRRGQSVVYAAEHLSLALLEVIVHLELAVEDFPADYVKVAIEIPDGIDATRIERLPRTDEEMLDIGSSWYESGTTAVLIVPSVIVPEENDLLLNPAQEDFRRIEAARPEPFRFDARLIARVS